MNEKNSLMSDSMSDNQLNPALAKPEDFEVLRYEDDNFAEPFHGQCGLTEKEYDALLKIREAGRSKEGNAEVAYQREKSREK